MTLPLQLAVILAASAAMRWLVRPLNQPAVIGEMVAGFLLGPSLLGWAAPAVSNAVFPTSSLTSLNAVSQLGLVLFMFVVGLRVQSHETAASLKRVAIVTSFTSIVVPFVLGVLVATTLLAGAAPAGVGHLAFALFVGVAMSITAFPVLARLLVDHRLLDTGLGRVAIACAAFDDVTGWLILAAVMTVVERTGGATLATRTMMFAAYLVIMMFVVRPLFARVASLGGTAAFAIMLLFVSAVATEWIGVHALFGAFFAGLMMPRGTAIERFVLESVEPVAVAVLLPVFFASTGLRTSVQLIDSASLWRDTAVILIAAILGKGGASMLAARWSGMRWRQAAALGALLNTRGLIELVILNIGLDAGILSPQIFSMMVLMTLVTTCMTSPLIVALLRKEEPGPQRHRVTVKTPRAVDSVSRPT